MSKRRRWNGGLVALVALVALTGASPDDPKSNASNDLPEIIELQAPSSRAVGFFPEGSQLRLLPYEEFQALRQRAIEASRRLSRPGESRLIRARHEARWEEGVLQGRSELIVQGPEAPGSGLSLTPWSPAIDPEETTMEVRTSSEGRIDLWGEQTGQFTTNVSWKLRARPGTKGRLFDLALPNSSLSQLILDLPEGQIPQLSGGLRAKAEPESEPGRRRWTFHGSGGSYDLRLLDDRGDASTTDSASTWVEGPTTIDVHGASASWRADWSIELPAVGARRLEWLLDPGLQPIGVSGPDVAGFSTTIEEDGTTRLTVELSNTGTTSTQVHLDALSKVPAEGPWRVPSAQPIGALWSGGSTQLRIGPNRIVESCQPLAGLPVPWKEEQAASDDPDDGSETFLFEGREPSSVAELVFRKPRIEAIAEVQGTIQLGPVVPQLNATVTWTLQQGPLLELALDLPPQWSPDQVQILEMDEPTNWRLSWRDDGGARVLAQVPTYLDQTQPIELMIRASAITNWGSTIEAPRVTPVEARLRREAWQALGEPGGRLRPVDPSGLVWVESPKSATDPDRDKKADTLPTPRLTWRWIEPDGQLQIERVGPTPRLVGECWSVARIEPGRLRWDGYLVLSGDPWNQRSIQLRMNESLAAEPVWRTLGDEVGPPLFFRPVEDGEPSGSEGSAANSEAGETLWELTLPPWPESGRLVLRASLEQPWNGQGKLPMFATSDWELARGAVLVFTDRSLRPIASPDGLLRSDRNALRRAFEAFVPGGLEGSAFSQARQRLSHGFEFGPELGQLDLRTEPLRRAASSGLILEARLIGTEAAVSGKLRRLVLQVATGVNRSLAVRLPKGATLVRAHSGSRRLTPIQEGPDLRFTLPASGSTQPVSELVLDYELTDEPNRGESEWPTFSVDCLARTREVRLPRSIEVVRLGPGMRSTDPAKPNRLKRPGPFFQNWSDFWDRSSKSTSRAILADLQSHFQQLSASESSLGECLTRLDSGRWPLVVDRAALLSAGVDPETRIGFRAGALGNSETPGLGVFLATIGLTATPVGGAILITTPADAPELGRTSERLAWIELVHQAATRGCDINDRLQSVARWRGAFSTDSTAVPDPQSWDVGWRSDRWAALGAPEGSAKLQTLDRQAIGSLAWAAIWLTLALGTALQRSSARVRAITLAVLMAIGLLSLGLTGGRWAVFGSGLIVGSFALATFWLGMAWRSARLGRSSRRSSVSRTRRTDSGSSSPILFILLGLLGPTLIRSPMAAEEVEPRPDEPILVVLPFEEAEPDANRPPEKALLRLSDFERLKSLAEARPVAQLEGPWTVRASHKVDRLNNHEARVLSEYQVRTGSEPSKLLIPIGNAREIRARVDGQPVHVRIVSGASQAELQLPSRSLQRLKVERLTPILPEGLLQLPVLPSATATLSVDRGPERPRVEISGAFGPIQEAETESTGWLGPSPAIDVRWQQEEPAGPVAKGTIEGLFLWRLEADGDHIQARLTLRRPEGTARLRLELEPGLVVRSDSFPGWSEAQLTGTSDHPIWEATISPPLADGETVQLELWRPRPEPEANGRELRSLPYIAPLDVEAHSGVIAVQQPDFWASEFEPAAIDDPILEDLFLRAWGPISGPRKALVGALSWAGTKDFRAWVRPAEPRPKLQPMTQLELSTGRVDVRVEVICRETSGPVSELIAELPEGFQVLEVEGDNLAAWSLADPNRLRLRFLPTNAKQRTLRIHGWLPALPGSDPPETEAQEVPLPWLNWPGAQIESGQVAVSTASRTPFRLEQLRGLSALRDPTADEGGGNRALYRVTADEPSAKIRWSAESAQADVTLRSLLSFHPGMVEWLALVRYQFSGGPCQSIQLELPTEWAEHLDIQFEQPGAQIQRESQGSRTTLSIQPERPVWGLAEVLLRARRPWSSELLSFPDLVPIGSGQVSDALLAWDDLSGRKLTAEGSAGLQQVAASRFHLRGLPTPDYPDRKVYQVLRGRWALRFRASGEPATSGQELESRRVRLADVVGNLDASGKAIGQVQYLLAPGEEPFLTLQFPEGIEPLAATVDGVPVSPWLQPGGPLFIPIGEPSASKVTLLWQVSEAKSGLDWPRPLESNFPTLVTFHAPAEIQIQSNGGSLAPVAGASLEVERLEQRTQALLDMLGHFDRSSPRERALLIASLVRLELQSRSSNRMVRWGQPGDSIALDGEGGRLLARIQASDALRSRALSEAGLESFLQTARVRSGVDLESEAMPLDESAGSWADLRIRRLGQPTYFQGFAESDSKAPLLRWKQTGHSLAEPRINSWRPLLATLLVVPVAWLGLFWRQNPGRLILLTILGSLLVFSWLGLAPLGLGLGLLMFGVGLIRGQEPSEESGETASADSAGSLRKK